MILVKVALKVTMIVHVKFYRSVTFDINITIVIENDVMNN